MQKQTTPKKSSTSTRLPRFRPIWLLSLIAFLFVLSGVFLAISHHLQASTSKMGVSLQPSTAIVTKAPQQPAIITPIASQTNSKKTGPPQPPATPVHTIIAATPIVATTTPTLIASTPEHTQLGVFPLSSGGPLPVPESLLPVTYKHQTLPTSSTV